jgi:Transglutaminase-like enzymes, putative cysteine proteases
LARNGGVNLSKECQDGLSIDRSFYMENVKRGSFQLSARIIQFFAILIGGWVFVSVLKESLNISINTLIIYPAILIATGILFALCLYPAMDLVKLFFSLLFYGLFFFSRLDKIMNGFYILENLVLDRMAEYYNYASLQFKADYISETADTTLLIIMIMLPVMALLTIAIIRNRLLHITCIILCLPIAICFLVGLIPSEKCLIAYVAVVLYLVRSGFSFRSTADREQYNLIHGINCRAAVWLSLIGIALIFILKLFVTEENYGKLSGIKEAKTEVQSVLLNTSLEDIADKFKNIALFGDSISVGGLYGGKLGRDGKVEYTNSEQLIVTAPQGSFAEGMYLKGYVGSVYTGSSWKENSKDDQKAYEELLSRLDSGFSPINQTGYLLYRLLNDPSLKNSTNTTMSNMLSSNLSINMSECNVEYKDANKKYMYAPYFTDYGQLEGVKNEQDLYVAPEKKKEQYQFSYYFGFKDFMSYLTLIQIPDDVYLQYEKLYRDYVYQVYTKMPEEGLDKLKTDFSKETLPGAGTMEKIQYVQNYLQKNTSYSLKPGKLPDGEDFVEYFLYQSKKGYCAHYASAAALMLRSMGVPARYVEGYFITPEPSAKVLSGAKQRVSAYTGSDISQYYTDVAKVSVKDYNAHAWVEVYLDEYGWLPFDFTPGSAISSIIDMKNFASGKKDDIKPTKAAVTPTPAEKENNTDKKNADKQTSSTGVKNEKEYAVLDIAFLIAFIVLVISAVTIFLLYKFNKRNKIRNSRNRNKKALYLFREMETLLSITKGLPDRKSGLEDAEEYIRHHLTGIDEGIYDNFLEAVRKARFSKASISAGELSQVEAFYHALNKEVYEHLNPAGKIFYKIALLMEI